MCYSTSLTSNHHFTPRKLYEEYQKTSYMCLSGLSFHSVCHYHPLSTPPISTTLVPHQCLSHYTTPLSTSNNGHITLPFYTITPSPSFSHPVTHLHLHDCPSCNNI